MLRWLLKRLAYPVLTGGSVLLVAWSCRRSLPLPLVGAGLTVLSVLVIIALERVIPYSPRWAEFGEDERVDPLHFVFSERAYDAGALLSLGLFGRVSEAMHGMGLTLWPRGAPLVAQVALAMLLSDLALYWGHRLGHTVPFLWRLHAVHHTSPRLHWFSVWRSHPLDNLIRSAANVAPLALFGTPAEVMALMGAFSGMSVLLSHCNADLRTGPLDAWLNTPAVHRWHHARLPGEAHANYAPVLVLWDHLFGTRRIPAGRAPPEDVGLTGDGGAWPVGFLAQMKAPFQPLLWTEARQDPGDASPSPERR